MMNIITEKNSNEVELSLDTNGLWQIAASLNKRVNNDLRDFENKVVTPVQTAEFTFENNINKRIQGIESALNCHVTNHIEWGMTATVLLNNPINESYKRFATTYVNYSHEKFTFNVDAVIRDKLRGKTATNQTFLSSSYSLFSAGLI